MSPKLDRLEYYSDSDHAGDMPITSFSHTGTVIMLNKVPIHWRSKKQPKTSRSSAEAEIYALSDTLADARLNNWGLQGIGININPIINPSSPPGPAFRGTARQSGGDACNGAA